jgi:hypothetical protein
MAMRYARRWGMVWGLVGCVNEPPVVTFEAPVGAAVPGEIVTLSGTATDVETRSELLKVQWSSDLDGVLGTDPPSTDGSVVGALTLEAGVHQITLAVTDRGGQTTEVSQLLGVGDVGAPTCEILSPVEGQAVDGATEIVFRGLVDDDTTPLSELSVTVESDVDGLFNDARSSEQGVVRLFLTGLKFGAHVFTMVVVDGDGLSCLSSVNVFVGLAPTIQIITPEEGRIINVGEPLDLAAVVEDEGGDASSLVVTWRSNLDGVIGVGTEVDGLTSLLEGTHRLVAEVMNADGLIASDEVLVGINAPPRSDGLAFIDGMPTSAESVTAVFEGGDLDGPELITVGWSWTRDGEPVPGITGSVVTADFTAARETWVVTAVPFDGLAYGPPVTGSVLVVNAPPDLAGAEILGVAALGEMLTCSAVATDVDEEDEVAVSYRWILAGVELQQGPVFVVDTMVTPPSSVLVCEITATDGQNSTIVELEAVVLNTAPEVVSVFTSVASAQVGDQVICDGLVTDADGDVITSTYQWIDGSTGATIGQGEVFELLAGRPAPGGQVVCRLQISDGRGGIVVAEAVVLVENTPPDIQGVDVAPSPAYNDATMMCSINILDVDAEQVSVDYRWTRVSDGLALGEASSVQLDASLLHPGDVVRCHITAIDDSGGVSEAEADRQLQNREPVVGGALISPTVVRVGDTVRCDAVDVVDADGDDTVVNTFLEVLGGSASGNGELSEGFVRGDVIRCVARAEDPYGVVGASSATATVTVSNKAPGAPSVVIDPPLAIGGVDDLRCVVRTESVDDDGDQVSYSMSWLLNGTVSVAGVDGEWPGDTLTADQTQGGEIWSCVAVPTDDVEAGAEGVGAVEIWSSLADLTVAAGEEVVLTDGTYVYGTVLVEAGGILRIEGAVVIEAQAFVIEGDVDGDSGGFAGGLAGGPVDGVGSGGGFGEFAGAGSGAGYGGQGGSSVAAEGGLPYGNEDGDAVLLGSGGGAGLGDGGAGGAALTVIAEQIEVAGEVHLNGASGALGGGGGSGGGLYLRADTLLISGQVRVDGGAAGSGAAGGGSGGRMKLFYDEELSSGPGTRVSGGEDGGEPGSISMVMLAWP